MRALEERAERGSLTTASPFVSSRARLLLVVARPPIQVAGINYKVKVKVSEAECVHVLVYCPLPHTGEGPQLVSVEAGKKVDDKIE